MKRMLTCPQCLEELWGDESGDIPINKDDYVLQNLRDDGVYSLTCSQGHITYSIDQNPKFHILFHSGCHALLDGYSREAVTSYATSLERLYEFVTKVICKKMGMTQDLFNDAWKNVKNQSERQLGAFVFLYTIEYGKPPPLLKDVKFRNEVVHSGRIPDPDETIKFGQEVLDIEREILKETKDKNWEWMLEVIREEMEAKRAHVPPGCNSVGMVSFGIISIHVEGLLDSRIDLRESLKKISTEKEWWKFLLK